MKDPLAVLPDRMAVREPVLREPVLRGPISGATSAGPGNADCMHAVRHPEQTLEQKVAQGL